MVPQVKVAARIYFLDWLRIIAFLGVFIGHKYAPMLADLAANPNVHSSLRAVISFLYPLVEGGGAGVVIFFLVSGYIISQVALKENVTEFIIRRFFRIYPLYIVAVLVEASLRYLYMKTFVGWTVLLQQLSLLGYFFQTPHTLGNVEWTLRIEVGFYAFIVLLKVCGFFTGRLQQGLMTILVIAVGGLFLLPAIPGDWSQNLGYVNLYGPFLILGICFYMQEIRRFSSVFCVGMTLLVVFGYWGLVPHYQPAWSHAHFVIYGVIVFTSFWLLRSRMSLPAGALALSEMTYAVYLFHNWLYDGFMVVLSKVTGNLFVRHSLSFVAVMVACWMAIIFIERPAIALGRKVVKSLRQKSV